MYQIKKKLCNVNYCVNWVLIRSGLVTYEKAIETLEEQTELYKKRRQDYKKYIVRGREYNKSYVELAIFKEGKLIKKQLTVSGGCDN